MNIYVYDFSENDLQSAQNQNEKQNLAVCPKTFVGNEMFDGKMVIFCNFYDEIS